MTEYTGTDNLEIMAEAVNYNRFLNRLILNHAKKGDRILDFGAGIGTFASAISDRGFKVDCVEVDIEQASYTNTIGAAILSAHWKDPHFDPKQDAFYYVRVMEIPTPRWTTYDAAFFDIQRPDNVPATIQDRAYTSPIWYTR